MLTAVSTGIQPTVNTNFGIKLGMGGVSAGVSYANFSDSGNNDQEGINAGVAYSSGPMGVSLAYYHGEKDGNNGSAATLDGQAERDIIHLSAKYAMGPGVTFAGTLVMLYIALTTLTSIIPWMSQHLLML